MEYRNTNDYETIYMIKENNEDASIYMFNKYKPLIDKLAFQYSKRYNNVGIDYDDLYQEGMYGLAKAINGYGLEQKTLFFTYASVCIKREMGKLLLKAFRYKNTPLNNSISFDTVISKEGLMMEDVLYSDEDLVEKKLIITESRNNLMMLKYELDDVYSLIFELRLNGFSNKDIAVLLDLSYKDVDNYLRCMKKKLKKIIKNSVDIEYSMIQWL